ncbi:MAG TPA: alpha/beta fold hydrolase [Thermoanaerobaculia bacterium]|jgi:dienelactone hydrolase|nr:alpha/beta fold hydrolase [Thermoanaerobaculia bacterium]
MKRLLGLLLPLLLLPTLLPAQPPLALTPPARDLATTATDLIDHLAKGDFQAAASPFAEAMRTAAPPEKLAEIWTAVQNQMGAYKRRAGVRTEKQGGYDVAFVTVEFEKSTVDFKVVVDTAGRIAGFFIVPPQQPAAAAASDSTPPAAYVHKDAFRDREVTVDAGEWALPGTLSVPVGAGPFPAVVLVHGSGPNDRDETVEGNKPFRDLAWGLASRGVAVLRYEKRTRQHGARLAAVKDFTVRQETVDDALAAADLLRHTEGIDPRRVFVLGHSLGGMLIPRIGQRDPQLAGLIVMAGAAKPLEDIILEQVAYIDAADGVVTDPEKSRLESLRAEVARVKALKPDATGTALGAPVSYWLDLHGYNPPEAAKALKAPLLVLQGERDYQVTMDNFAAWKQALPNAAFHTYPKLNHLFVEGEGKSTPKEYEKPGHVSEAVIADIAEWIGRIRK